MEIVPVHLSGVQNFEMVPVFLKNLCTLHYCYKNDAVFPGLLKFIAHKLAELQFQYVPQG